MHITLTGAEERLGILREPWYRTHVIFKRRFELILWQWKLPEV